MWCMCDLHKYVCVWWVGVLAPIPEQGGQMQTRGVSSIALHLIHLMQALVEAGGYHSRLPSSKAQQSSVPAPPSTGVICRA